MTLLSRAERSSYIPGRGLQHHGHHLGQLPQHAGGAEGGEAHHLTHTLYQGQGGAVVMEAAANRNTFKHVMLILFS